MASLDFLKGGKYNWLVSRNMYEDIPTLRNSVQFIESMADNIERLYFLADRTAQDARLTPGTNNPDAWNSRPKKLDALAVLIVLWQTWTNSKKLGQHFDALAEFFMEQAFQEASPFPDFDRLLKEARRAVNSNPDRYLVLWGDKELGL